jgi:phenylacetate-CoA ligase
MSVLRAYYYLQKLRKDQWLKADEFEKLQIKRLRSIIMHAYRNTRFYHEKFRMANISPDDINSIEDLKKIPITTKKELREHGLRTMLAKHLNFNDCIITETSGSTGIPTKVVYDRKANDFSKAVNLRSHIENGLEFRSKWAIFGDPYHFQKEKWFQKLGILSPKWISVFDTTKQHINSLSQFNPDILDGYTSSIMLLAKKINEDQIESIRPRAIFGTSEILDDFTRRYINSTFGVDIVDLFGCVELNRTAWECSEHSGYHIDGDAVIMEFIRGGERISEGEMGEIIYTGLYNYAMPLIRYNIGDLAVPSSESCNCGRVLPLMKLIGGRSDSFMQTIDGRIFSPIIWTVIMRRIPGVSQFKVFQERKDSIKVFIIADSEYKNTTLDQIVQEIKNTMGEDMNVNVDIVKEIPKTRSGKILSAESQVKIDW